MTNRQKQRLWSKVQPIPYPGSLWVGVRLGDGLLPDNIHLFPYEYTEPPPPTTIGSYHPRYVFDVVLEGRGYVQIDQNGFMLEAGEAFVIFPHQYHFGGSEKAGARFGIAVTTFDLENDEAIRSLRSSPRRLRAGDYALFGAFVDAWKAGADGVELSALLARCLKSLAAAPAVKRRNVPSPVEPQRHELLQQIVELQDRGMGDTVAELAAKMKMDEAVLRDRFRQYVGQSLPDFLRKRRLQRAVQLLAQPGLSIGEISRRLRFSSIQTFSRIFKERFGVAPREYQVTVQRNVRDFSKQP